LPRLALLAQVVLDCRQASLDLLFFEPAAAGVVGLPAFLRVPAAMAGVAQVEIFSPVMAPPAGRILAAAGVVGAEIMAPMTLVTEALVALAL
jgi:hypothetical protein